jgi:hypothetical protein
MDWTLQFTEPEAGKEKEAEAEAAKQTTFFAEMKARLTKRSHDTLVREESHDIYADTTQKNIAKLFESFRVKVAGKIFSIRFRRGKFKFIKVLGAGGNGAVYQALDLEYGDMVSFQAIPTFLYYKKLFTHMIGFIQRLPSKSHTRATKTLLMTQRLPLFWLYRISLAFLSFYTMGHKECLERQV